MVPNPRSQGFLALPRRFPDAYCGQLEMVWVLQVAGSNPAAPTSSGRAFPRALAFARSGFATSLTGSVENDRADLQAGPYRDAIGQGEDQGMGLRLRARAAAVRRAADGLDQFGRHEAAAAASIRHQARGDRLLRTQRDRLSGVRCPADKAPKDLLLRQFRL